MYLGNAYFIYFVKNEEYFTFIFYCYIMCLHF